MEEESPIDRILREDYGITDVANADYSAGNEYVAKIRKHYDKMLDQVLNFNFGKVTGLKKIINALKF